MERFTRLSSLLIWLFLLVIIAGAISLAIFYVHSRTEQAIIDRDEFITLLESDPYEAPDELDMLLFEIRSIRDDVQMAEDRAFNALSVLEIFGVILTVGSIILGGLGAFYGLRVRQLFNELRETRDRYNELMQNVSLSLSLLPLAKEQYLANDLPGALKTYQEASTLNPHNPLPYSQMGYIYTKKENFDKAEEFLKKALHIKPDLAHANAGLGFVYRRRGDLTAIPAQKEEYYRQAKRYLYRGLSEFPSLVDGEGESWWGTLGGLEKRRGRTSLAREHYEEARKVTPQSSYPLNNLALLEIEDNKIKSAREQYRKIIPIAKKEADAELGNYWAYGDLLTARLACALPDDNTTAENIQRILDTLKIILSDSDIKDALNRIVETIETIQQAFDDNNTPYRSDLFELALEQLKTYPGYNEESRTSSLLDPNNGTDNDEPGQPSQSSP
jgi:tetratricopeptide (TPR) repeat protein